VSREFRWFIAGLASWFGSWGMQSVLFSWLVVGELHAVPFELGIPRVYTVLKLDERRDKEQTLEDKVASVERLLKDGG